MKKQTAYFLAYIQPRTYSGQAASTDLIVAALMAEAYNFVTLPMYSVNRAGSSKVKSLLEWCWRTMKTVPRVLQLMFARQPVLYLNLGLGYFSFLRVLWWYLPVRLLRPKLPVVISLHGHSYTAWNRSSLQCRILLALLRGARLTTILGPVQASWLQEAGIPADRIQVVPNTCSVPIWSQDAIAAKHQGVEASPVKLLFLSLLVASKGFPEYLEALLLLSKRTLPMKVEATLCGPITLTAFCSRFANAAAMEAWIEAQVAEINNSGQVQVRWVRGATGTDKENLFAGAHIFVLPTRYPNEVQPLVLLEAMASGCAVITSKAGEIPSTISSEQGVLLDEPGAEQVADEIERLIAQPQLRTQQALRAQQLMYERYSMERYRERWQQIFATCCN